MYDGDVDARFRDMERESLERIFRDSMAHDGEDEDSAAMMVPPSPSDAARRRQTGETEIQEEARRRREALDAAANVAELLEREVADRKTAEIRRQLKRHVNQLLGKRGSLGAPPRDGASAACPDVSSGGDLRADDLRGLYRLIKDSPEEGRLRQGDIPGNEAVALYRASLFAAWDTVAERQSAGLGDAVDMVETVRAGLGMDVRDARRALSVWAQRRAADMLLGAVASLRRELPTQARADTQNLGLFLQLATLLGENPSARGGIPGVSRKETAALLALLDALPPAGGGGVGGEEDDADLKAVVKAYADELP